MTKRKRKRKTKADREAEQLAALRQRVEDIMAGAGVHPDYDEYDEPQSFVMAEEVPRIAQALRVRLKLTEIQDSMVRTISNADEFDTSKRLTAWLYDMGVRA